MSNKSLFITVVVVVIVLVAAFVAYGAYQKHQTVTGSGDQTQASAPAGSMDLSNNTPTPPVATSTPTSTSTPAMATYSPTATTNGACVRNFSQTELNNNANMDIHDKFVTIDVADFGDIKIQLYDQDAPKTVENFLRLTDSGYYNCLTFHRVAPGFVIQGGDPNGDGTGGTSAYGAPFADELNPNTPSYKAGYVQGVVAMANSGPNTNGSQFFIMLADNQLPHNYTIFGKVVSGQNVVNAIGNVPINPPSDGKPLTPVVMESLKITNN
jgi:cyclophilin family peptidyl-prolyl cis-trans isomerase